MDRKRLDVGESFEHNIYELILTTNCKWMFTLSVCRPIRKALSKSIILYKIQRKTDWKDRSINLQRDVSASSGIWRFVVQFVYSGEIGKLN